MVTPKSSGTKSYYFLGCNMRLDSMSAVTTCHFYLKTGIGGLSSGQGMSLRVDRSHELHTLYMCICTTAKIN